MQKRHYKKWTNDEDLVIISMRAANKTSIEISKELGRSFWSVRNRIKKLINECKVELKQTRSAPLDYDKIGDYVARNPGNIQNAFRKFAKDNGCSVSSVHSAYYCKSRRKQRVKDSGNFFTLVGKTGHTTNNSKICNSVKRSNLWTKLKEWLLSSLLS